MEKVSDIYERSWLKITFDTEEAKANGKQLLSGFVQIRDVTVLSEEKAAALQQKLSADLSIREYNGCAIPTAAFEAKEEEEDNKTEEITEEQNRNNLKSEGNLQNKEEKEDILAQLEQLGAPMDSEPPVYDSLDDWKKAPTNLKATTTPGRVTLSWSHNGPASTLYGIYEIVGGKGTLIKVTEEKTITLERITSGNHEYAVAARKKNSDGVTEVGTRSAGKSISVKDWEAMPTSVTALVSGYKVTLSWSHSGADAFGVYELIDGKGKLLTTTTDKKVTLNDIEPGEHILAVSARVKFSDGWALGNRSTGTTASVETWTAAPTSLKATVSGGTVKLSFAHGGSEAYGVYEVNNGSPTLVKKITAKVISLADVTPGKHTYLIRPWKFIDGKWVVGRDSTTVSVSVATWTKAPTNLVISAKYSTITMTWDYDGSATTFGVYEKGETNNTLLKIAKEKTVVIDNIEPGTHTYYVAPRMKNDSGVVEIGARSTEKKKTIINWKAEPETTSLSIKGSAVSISWSHESAEAYGVYEIINGKGTLLSVVTNKTIKLTEIGPGEHIFGVSARVKDSTGKWLTGSRSQIVVNVGEWVAAPKNLNATVSGSAVKLTWSHTGGATAFGVYEVISGKATLVKQATTNSLTISDVDAGNHKYIVKSWKQNDNGSWEVGCSSEQISASVEEWTIAPLSVKAEVIGSQVSLSWSHSKASKFGIYEVVDGKAVLKTSTTSKTGKLNEVEPGSHTYLIKAWKQNADGKWEVGTKSAQVKVEVPVWVKAPEIKTSTVNGSKITLGWTHSGADAYGVYEVVSGKNVLLTTTSEKIVQITEVKPGKHTYNIAARQKDQNGTLGIGCRSVNVTLTVESWAVAPTNLKATVSGSKVTLSWSHSGGEAFGVYEVINGKPVLKQSVNTKKLSLENVAPGTHKYLVRAWKKNASDKWDVGCSSTEITTKVDSWTAAPTSFTVSVTDITITFSWAHVGGADAIGIYEVIDGKNVLVKTATGTSFTMTATDGGEHVYLLGARKKNSSGTIEIGSKTATKKIFVNDYTASNKVVYSLSNSIWTVKKYNGTATSVTIPAKVLTLPVKAIGESAFEDNAHLTTIDLPDSIEIIGAKAFKNCTNLANMK